MVREEIVTVQRSSTKLMPKVRAWHYKFNGWPCSCSASLASVMILHLPQNLASMRKMRYFSHTSHLDHHTAVALVEGFIVSSHGPLGVLKLPTQPHQPRLDNAVLHRSTNFRSISTTQAATSGPALSSLRTCVVFCCGSLVDALFPATTATCSLQPARLFALALVPTILFSHGA